MKLSHCHVCGKFRQIYSVPSDLNTYVILICIKCIDNDAENFDDIIRHLKNHVIDDSSDLRSIKTFYHGHYISYNEFLEVLNELKKE